MSGGLPSGSDPSQMTPHPYSIIGGGLSALNTRTEGNVRATLEAEVRSDPGISSLSNQVFAGLNPVLGLAGGIVEGFLRKILGVFPFIDFDAVESVMEQLLNQVESFFGNFRNFLGEINFLDPDFDPVDAAFAFIELVLTPTGLLSDANWEDLYEVLSGIGNTGGAALEAIGDFLKYHIGGAIKAFRIPLIPLSHIRNVNRNLLIDGQFEDANAVAGSPDWTYNTVDGYQKVGCVSTVADGNTHTLYSNRIEVAADDNLSVKCRVKYDDVVATATTNPIRLMVSAYDEADVLQETVLVAGIPSPSGDQPVWTQISGTYPVHDEADYVVVEFQVTNNATAGLVKFDAGDVRKVGEFKQTYVSGLIESFQTAASNLQNLINKLWEGLLRQNLPFGIDALLENLTDALQNIPPINILGITGGNIVDTIQNTIDRLWGGFTRIFGIGGKSMNDVQQKAAELAETAETSMQVAEWNNAILAIRTNEPLYTGIDSTEESTFLLTDMFTGLSEPPSFGVTSTASAIGFWRATNDATKGFISWFGKGFTNVTGLYADLYKFDYEFEQMVYLHSSPNLVGQVTNSWGYVQYFMDPEDRIAVAHGDVLGFQIRVEGSGTHTVAGRQAPWEPEHPNQYPKKLAATRNTTIGGGVSTLDFTDITWSGNLPWVGIGIVTGDIPPAYFAPRTTAVTDAGIYVYEIPEWATMVDVIMVGGGGGGHGGNPVNGGMGNGGLAGEWASETLVRGVDFVEAGGEVVVYVGTGGAGGTWNTPGGHGVRTYREALPMGKAEFEAAGGLRGTGQSGHTQGYDAPDYEYNGNTYSGGAGGGVHAGQVGRPGEAPGAGGGGGAGGTWGIAWNGAAGARGGAWLVARMQ